ncbi:MAG: LysM domain-containing protein [Actinomycetota bacterium]|nr:LysM domain-containing protein [Actinomycetota bacterium]
MTAVLIQGKPTGLPVVERTERARLVLYRPGAPTNARAARVEAGPARAALYRRRRLMVGGLFLLSVAAVLFVVQLFQAGIGGGPLTTTGAAAGPGMIQAGATDYVVRPGDTLWSIAAGVAPGRDERPVVDQLVRELGTSDIYPGEVVRLQPAG